MEIKQRRFPYPYKSMIAFSSDLEGTGLKDHERIHQFINTKKPNSEMPFYSYDGLGIQWSDSFFFHGISHLHMSIFNPVYEFTDFQKYYDEDLSGRVDRRPNTIDPVTGEWLFETPAADYIEKAIRAGWIDFLHGGHADNGEVLEAEGVRNWTRRDGELYLQWIEERGLKGMVPVFINHSNVTADFGAVSIDPQGYRVAGDDPNSPAYWVDLAIESGIKFYWSYNPSDGAAYRATMGKTSMLEPKTFRDGNKYWHFSRYYSPGGTKGDQLADGQLSLDLLNYIETNGLFEVAYTHLGSATYALDGNVVDPEIGVDSQGALKALSDRHEQGRICATNITKLLKYDLALHYLRYSTELIDGRTVINITAINDTQFGAFVPIVDDLRGVTFYVPNNQKAEIRIMGNVISESEVTRNPQDATGQESIGVKWHEDDTTDYTTYSLTQMRETFPALDLSRDPVTESSMKINIAHSEGRELINLNEGKSGMSQVLIQTPDGVKSVDLVEVDDVRAGNLRIRALDGVKALAKF